MGKITINGHVQQPTVTNYQRVLAGLLGVVSSITQPVLHGGAFLNTFVFEAKCDAHRFPKR